MSSSSLLLKRFGELRQDDDEESSKRIKTAMCAVIVATVINKVTLHYTVPNRLPPTVRDRSPLVTDCKLFVTVHLFEVVFFLTWQCPVCSQCFVQIYQRRKFVTWISCRSWWCIHLQQPRIESLERSIVTCRIWYSCEQMGYFLETFGSLDGTSCYGDSSML